MRSPGFDSECNIKLGIVAYTCSSGLGRQKQDDQGFKASLIYLRFFLSFIFFVSRSKTEQKPNWSNALCKLFCWEGQSNEAWWGWHLAHISVASFVLIQIRTCLGCLHPAGYLVQCRLSHISLTFHQNRGNSMRQPDDTFKTEVWPCFFPYALCLLLNLSAVQLEATFIEHLLHCSFPIGAGAGSGGIVNGDGIEPRNWSERHVALCSSPSLYDK